VSPMEALRRAAVAACLLGRTPQWMITGPPMPWRIEEREPEVTPASSAPMATLVASATTWRPPPSGCGPVAVRVALVIVMVVGRGRGRADVCARARLGLWSCRGRAAWR
jgi:hypothetical protein